VTIAAPVLLGAARVPETHAEALLGAAAIGAVFSLLFMVKGLLIFDPRPGPKAADGRDSATGDLAVPRWNMALVRAAHLPHHPAALAAHGVTFTNA